MQHKNITVTTNDPKHQIIMLKMVGYVGAPAAKPTPSTNPKVNKTH